MSAAPYRVLCVDDHAVLVEGLRAKIDLTRELEFVGHLATAEGLVTAVQRTRPHVVVLDIEMPGPDPFEAARDVHARCPGVRVVFLSAYVRDRFLDAAFEAGAWGYLYKGDDLDSIIAGIRNVAAGEFVMGPKIIDRSRARAGRAAGHDDPPGGPSSRLNTLTPRELHVLTLIGRGLSRNEIAVITHRSVKTIDTHRAAIMDKLDIHDRTELALFAVREGLVES